MLQLILLILLGAALIAMSFKWRSFCKDIIKAIVMALGILIGLMVMVKYYSLVVTLLGCAMIYFYMMYKLNRRMITKWCEEEMTPLSKADIEEIMLELSQDIQALDTNLTTYKFDGIHMPLGRVNAFLSYFQTSIDKEEAYYFSVYPSKQQDEIREYGTLLTQSGIYITKQFPKNAEGKYKVQKMYIPFKNLWHTRFMNGTLSLQYIDPQKHEMRSMTLLQRNVDMPLKLIHKMCETILTHQLPKWLYRIARGVTPEGLQDVLHCTPKYYHSARKFVDAICYEYLKQEEVTVVEEVTPEVEDASIVSEESSSCEDVMPVLEVPKDQYRLAKALIETQNVSVRLEPSHFTYHLVEMIYASGSIEGLVKDVQDDTFYGTTKSISELIECAMDIWQIQKIENPMVAFKANKSQRVSILSVQALEIREMFQILKEEILDISMQCPLNTEEFNRIINRTLYSPNRFNLLKDMYHAIDPRQFAKENIAMKVVSEVFLTRQRITESMLNGKP